MTESARSTMSKVAILGVASFVLAEPFAYAIDWSAAAYDLYFGDFNGDGKSDVLYVAKDPAGISGISLSDGTGPNLPLQSWASNYLGVPWSGNQYNIVVADFSGDGKSDLLLQRKAAGDSYLLHANSQGKFAGIAQTIGNTTAGLVWTAGQHRVVAGDFNNDGKADVFLQATSRAGLNAVVVADSGGAFTASTPTQSWNDGYLGLNWATNEAIVFAANFDGQLGADLLVQARPAIALIDYDVTVPIFAYPPNMNGMVASQSGSPIFQLAGLKSWSRNTFGVDWSPQFSNVVFGDFNGGAWDVVLQGRSSGRNSYLLSGNSSGSAFAAGSSLPSGATWTADAVRLYGADFSGSGGGIYLQGMTAATANAYVSLITGGTVSSALSSPSLAASLLEYTYDALGRLQKIKRSGAVGIGVETTYNLDATGNRESVVTIATP